MSARSIYSTIGSNLPTLHQGVRRPEIRLGGALIASITRAEGLQRGTRGSSHERRHVGTISGTSASARNIWACSRIVGQWSAGVLEGWYQDCSSKSRCYGTWAHYKGRWLRPSNWPAHNNHRLNRRLHNHTVQISSAARSSVAFCCKDTCKRCNTQHFSSPHLRRESLSPLQWPRKVPTAT